MSVAVETKENTLCNILFDEFSTLFPSLSIADLCPVCDIPGGRHQRRETILNKSSTSGGKNILSSTSTAFMKLEKLLPQYTKDTDVRQFIKTIENRSISDHQSIY
jgi:hypothetical protein